MRRSRAGVETAMNRLTFDGDGFYLDGKPFRIISGDIHYFRIHEKDWEKRLDLALDFGLNTVQTYVPWNAHEPRPGEYDFGGMLDIGGFLKLCGEKGLKVLLRPSPYICSEWDLGGRPSLLLKDRELTLRSSDPEYLKAVRRYYDHLIPRILPYLAGSGGPVIAVAVENEYGSFGSDHAYLKALADMLHGGGVDVPLYTTDGDSNQMLTFGSGGEDGFFGVNYRAKPGLSQHACEAARGYRPDKPFFVGELWAGRSMHWGEPFRHRDPKETSEAFREALGLGANVSFYMFSGGTNFGFMGGANFGHSYSPRPGTPARYIPHTTSYSEDTMIGEGGEPTEKYFLCRDVLDEYMGREKRPRFGFARRTQSFKVKLDGSAGLFDNLDALAEKHEFTASPKPMEYFGQDYGLILYSTKAEGTESGPVTVRPYKYKDRASIYVDGRWFASFLRDRGLTKSAEGTPLSGGWPALIQDGKEKRIDILAENTGRINFGVQMSDERKGLDDCLLYGGLKLFGYETRTLPLRDLSRVEWRGNIREDHMPRFFRGSFDAESGTDAYICFENFGHGYIWVNGFNAGRYDGAGPQMTLYLPGHFLKDRGNEIVVLDIDPVGEKTEIGFLDHEILEGDSSELK